MSRFYFQLSPDTSAAITKLDVQDSALYIEDIFINRFTSWTNIILILRHKVISIPSELHHDKSFFHFPSITAESSLYEGLRYEHTYDTFFFYINSSSNFGLPIAARYSPQPRTHPAAHTGGADYGRLTAYDYKQLFFR